MRIAKSNGPELRHIVDVDGQLIGIEPAMISTAVLKALTRVEGDLLQVRGAFEVRLRDCQSITLREDEILYFRTCDRLPQQTRLAA